MDDSLYDLCDIGLDDDAVSREHARIKFDEGAFYIDDLLSSNGTMVNGQRIQRHELRDRDEIRIGDTNMIFVQVAASQDLTVDARRRLREFDQIWYDMTRSIGND